MSDLEKSFNFRDLISQEPNDSFSLFNEKKYEDEFHNMTFNTSREERNFFNENERNKLLNKKRKNKSTNKARKPHTKYTYDNLKRECKHLVIENAKEFINKKIKEAYNGNIGDGVLKKELVKLNQEQKKNSSVEFNQLFLNKTLKEILSQKITKKFKFYDQDHNKNVIEIVIKEKKDEFEKIFNITFIECLKHFIGIKQICELNGFTLFEELKEQIVLKYEDGESYYQNLEIFLKEFEKRINNAKPRNKVKQ